MREPKGKYFLTAEKMDKAFLALLEKKEFSYITVKEICEKAGVNRSTFYLHYETIGDLLAESVAYLHAEFQDYIRTHAETDAASFISGLKTCPVEELYLITPQYLMPYLNYVKAHKQLFRTVSENAVPLRAEHTYGQMFRYVFTPILERFQVPEQERHYIMAFYMHGLMAIIAEWLKEDCADTVEQVIAVMQRCVMYHLPK